MGVFKWLRRERVTVTTHHDAAPATTSVEHSRSTHVSAVRAEGRTEDYKRDLAEFQARRSLGTRELPITPVKKKCSRHSLPCTDCANDNDTTFNYEKKSAAKYKKKSHKRAKSAAPDDRNYEALPNIQFLFQNQVFMPGNLFPSASFTDPQRVKRTRPRLRSPDFSAQKRIDFDEDLNNTSPPLFYKNNALPFDVQHFLNNSKSDVEEVDGAKMAGDGKVASSHTSVKDDSCEEKLWEVMSELKNFDQWADEQLQVAKSDDSRSDTSAFGLPVASCSTVDVDPQDGLDKGAVWSRGKWGVVPVRIKRLPGVTAEHARARVSTEINILRKYRHPNIILLMGLYPDVHTNVNIICETFLDSLYGILHAQGRILSAQTSVQYALDIANALVFLNMQGYLHTELNSSSVVVTSHNAAKISDLSSCVRLKKTKEKKGKNYEVYSPEPQYANIEDTGESNEGDSEPLISKRSSETYLATRAVPKRYESYCNSEQYRWQAPELFEPDEEGNVYVCPKSDVYSLSLILWECCNAAVPWKTLTYGKLKELYILWNTGIRLPQDGTYPGCLLDVMQSGLRLNRAERIDLVAMQSTLQNVKSNIDDLEYIIIPARISKKKSNFSSVAWDTSSPTDESGCQSPVPHVQHKAVVHNAKDSSTDSSDKSCSSPLYETIRKECSTYTEQQICYISEEENSDKKPLTNFQHLPEKEYSSACSTPVTKIRARIKDIGTPGALHRSDSTEYCSFLSPDQRDFALIDDNKDQSDERPAAKLSRSFTPKSYKPLHIKVTECNLEPLKTILKERTSSERSSYNFDIQNYSLPTTPIARSNKLRKNAWLSGDLSINERRSDKSVSKTPEKEEFKMPSAPETPANTTGSSEIERKSTTPVPRDKSIANVSHESVDTARGSLNGQRSFRVEPQYDFSTPEIDDNRNSSWSFKSSIDRPGNKYRVEEEVLANVNVKPLVAIHEKWIYEANRKSGRSMSLPEDNSSRSSAPAVKPASHCVDTLQTSLPHLSYARRPPGKTFRASPATPRNDGHWEQFCHTRETIARSMNFAARDPERNHSRRKGSDGQKQYDIETSLSGSKVDRSTDTRGIEEFIKDLIRKEFQHLIHEISDENSNHFASESEELLSKGVENIVQNLRNGDEEPNTKKDTIKSFSRLKINGNNKPLLQIIFSKSGENSLQVLDNCVNVKICEGSGREKLNQSFEDTLTNEDGHVQSLKRCQAFNAIQEAKSTEDLYIDDDLSTQMQENFGGRVKLIPLHGSLHEILCEKEDECCLIKVKQENGCDTIYFKCDNSDTESRDAIDGGGGESHAQDTVVYKRSISLIEERIQRIFPKEKRPAPPTPVQRRRLRNDDTIKTRPKSEDFANIINEESRVLSYSSPSLATKLNDEVEVNIENVMSYQDSSSEECVKCQVDDDFEILERKIEEDIANSNLSSLTCGCLQKISEENLSEAISE